MSRTSQGRQHKAVADWDGAAVEYLRQYVAAMRQGGVPRRIERLVDDVWRVHLQDGTSLVAKHHMYGVLTRGTAYDLLQVEKRVLEVLAGRCVPRLLGLDVERQFAFYEDCGRLTLDAVGQQGDPAALDVLVGQVVPELCAIETMLAREVGLGDCVMPQASRQGLAQQWEAAGAGARNGLQYVLGEGEPSPLQALQQLLDWLGGRPPRLGAIDYNARNIAVDGNGGIAFLEWAKIGWDWTERRLVQYTTSMGGGRRDGEWVCPLDATVAALYARACKRGDAAAALDGHHLVFHLNAVAVLGTALAEGDAALLKYWARPRRRLQRLVEALAVRLSGDPLVEQVRRALGGAEPLAKRPTSEDSTD